MCWPAVGRGRSAASSAIFEAAAGAKSRVRGCRSMIPKTEGGSGPLFGVLFEGFFCISLIVTTGLAIISPVTIVGFSRCGTKPRGVYIDKGERPMGGAIVENTPPRDSNGSRGHLVAGAMGEKADDGLVCLGCKGGLGWAEEPL